MVLVPRRELEFLDNWDVLGLCGTGSSDFRLKDVQVAEDFISGWFPSDRPPGSLYRIPRVATALKPTDAQPSSSAMARAALRMRSWTLVFAFVATGTLPKKTFYVPL